MNAWVNCFGTGEGGGRSVQGFRLKSRDFGQPVAFSRLACMNLLYSNEFAIWYMYARGGRGSLAELASWRRARTRGGRTGSKCHVTN